ncbi:hypothetical protein EYF80_017543 [Liparis tanakae]|uniref:Uncharacterized protein n=1 Tax=Liparis tanakae TaxID=230148 RepID=A0A4Z2I2F4_9TELE|nr:hypothetical protein EYF80_017543 [Liparis tanakae]
MMESDLEKFRREAGMSAPEKPRSLYLNLKLSLRHRSTLDDAQPRLVCRTAAVRPASLHTGHMAAATTQRLQTWLEDEVSGVNQVAERDTSGSERGELLEAGGLCLTVEVDQACRGGIIFQGGKLTAVRDRWTRYGAVCVVRALVSVPFSSPGSSHRPVEYSRVCERGINYQTDEILR